MNHTLNKFFGYTMNFQCIDIWGADLEKKAYESALFTAHKARVMLYNALRSCIQNYYKEYTPKVYNRTYEFMNNSYKGYERHRSNQVAIGGVRISADNIPDDNYGTEIQFGDGFIYTDDDAWDVIENNMQGYHGYQYMAYAGVNIERTMQLYLKKNASKIENIFVNDFYRRIEP